MGSTINKNFVTGRPSPKWVGVAISQSGTIFQMAINGPLPFVLGWGVGGEGVGFLFLSIRNEL